MADDKTDIAKVAESLTEAQREVMVKSKGSHGPAILHTEAIGELESVGLCVTYYSSVFECACFYLTPEGKKVYAALRDHLERQTND